MTTTPATPATIQSPSEQECMQWRQLIEAESGIVVSADKSYLIETRLTCLLRQHGCESYGQFYQKVKQPGNKAILTQVIDQMTTNETLWFRDGGPFEEFKNRVLPELVERARSGQLIKPLRIWSAASSTGQEAYSLAIIIDEYLRTHVTGLTRKDFMILGTDICSNAVEKASSGCYDGFSITRGMDDAYKTRYFEQQGHQWQIKPEIREMVSFEQRNLKDSFDSLGRFDVVFLRNVLIYFNDAFKEDILTRMAKVMRPPGYLFVGATEIVSACAKYFQANSLGKSMYYQLK